MWEKEKILVTCSPFPLCFLPILAKSKLSENGLNLDMAKILLSQNCVVKFKSKCQHTPFCFLWAVQVTAAGWKMKYQYHIKYRQDQLATFYLVLKFIS